jgi:hypothetical protein
MIEQIGEAILKLLENHEGIYPLYTKEIEEILDLPNQKVLTELKKLLKKGLIFTRRVTWITGYRNYHILAKQQWPTFLSTQCKLCHYKSTIRICIFHNDLHEQNAPCELERVNTQFNENCVGCPWYIARETGVEKFFLEDFLELSISANKEYVNRTNEHLSLFEFDEFTEEEEIDRMLPKYHCIFCSEEFHLLGSGFFPLLGSSIIRCGNCESMYKLVYNEKEDRFLVHCAEEFGDLYRHNFEQVAGFPSNTEIYSSPQFGISIPENVPYYLDTDSETIVVANFVGKLQSMQYIVTRTKEDYEAITKALGKDYPRLRVIDGQKTLVSPQPTIEEIGLLKLLRETKLLNASFCHATLKSRKAFLASLQGIVNEELRLTAIDGVNDQIKKLRRYQLLDVNTWNAIERDAANAMYVPIKDFMTNEGIEFPGRVDGRYVHDRFKPFGLYYAYSEIDAIINGFTRITSNIVKEYCSLINFCWDGLPGICHEKTHGGIFGFHLDLIEPFKLAALTMLCKAILEEKFDFEAIENIIGRRRQAIYFVRPASEINKQLQEQVKFALNQRGKNFSLKKELEQYFLQVKFWFQGLLDTSFSIRVTHHGQEFAAWTLYQYQIWQFLTMEQKLMVELELHKLIKKLRITPYVFQKPN